MDYELILISQDHLVKVQDSLYLESPGKLVRICRIRSLRWPTLESCNCPPWPALEP